MPGTEGRDPCTDHEEETVTARRNVVLLVLVVAMFVAVLVGGWQVWQRVGEREEPPGQRALGEVVAVASAHAEALANLRHDDPASLAAARDTATAELRPDYEPDGAVAGPVVRDRSTLEGDVVWAGLEEMGADEATALVATSGTVTSQETGGDEVGRDLRLRLTLVRVQGRWLVDDVELVS